MGHELPGSVWGQTGAAPVPSQAARQGQLCSTPWSPRRVCSALSISQAGPWVSASAPVPWLPRGRSPAQDVLQQGCRGLGQDLLQPLLLPSAERSQDIAGHCHFALWPPDADPEPGHLLGRKKESWRSFTSRVHLRQSWGKGTVLRVGLGSERAAPHVFQVVLSACSKKHDFGRSFCWAVLRSQALARPGRAARANCFHVLRGGQTDISPQGSRGKEGKEKRGERKLSRGLSEGSQKNGSGGMTSHALRWGQD